MSLKKEFNATVIYQLHSQPPWLGLYSKKLGYTQIHLRELNLSQAQIDALCKADKVSGTYEPRQTPEEIFITNEESIKDPRKGRKLSTWKVTSLKPA